MTLRLGVYVTHPIQYMAPVWRHLAHTPGVALKVHFFSDCSVRGEIDPDFCVPVAWDVPLLDGYDYTFLDRFADQTEYRCASIPQSVDHLRASGFDWVMVHGYVHRFERQVLCAARRLGIRTLLRGELTDGPRPGRPLWKRLLRGAYLRWFYRKVDAFCYLGHNGREHLLGHGAPAGRLFFSPYAVDTELFEILRSRQSRAEARVALGIAERDVVILYSGKFIPRKAPLLLVEAARRLAAADRLHLILVGDGPQRSEVEAAARAAIGQRVTVPGFVNQTELGRYFAAADVFVLPSEFETWGLVVNEAMQFGLPAVVSSGVGCHHDLVIPGRTGLVFPSGDADALARCLRPFLNDLTLACRLGEEARRHVGRYTPEASVDGILEALRSCG